MAPKSVLLFVVALTTSTSLCNSDDFPQPTNNERDTTAKPMSPAEAAASMRVPNGFSVSVFASEPDVQNPIGMNWDSKGRLWVAENYTYSSRDQRFDLGLRDRVIVLEDSTGDGTADTRTVFTDQVQMLTSVEVGHGGAWLMCPPRVLFIPDRDHDALPDGPAEVVLDGFTVAKANYHNFANGLKWGPDGWLYGRCGGSCPGSIGVPGTPDEDRLALEGGIWRYHPRLKRVEVLAHGTTNPWGHDWNSMGELFFINTVNGHLWHMIPGSHLKRPFTLDPNTKTYELLDMHADHWHFDTGSTWQKSRDGAANAFGGGHAHTGMMIYQGDNWPEKYRDRLFTFNIHGQRANQEILERHGSGYVGHHGKDMMLAADPFFRGNDMSYGPDGSVSIIDWSDTGECHEHTGVHRTSGRVYRIAYGEDSQARLPTKDLRMLPDVELVAMHHHQNEWYVRQSRLILSGRAASGSKMPNAKVRLTEMVSNAAPLFACRALLTLHAMDATTRELLIDTSSHSNEHIRTWSIRMLTDHWPIDDIFGPKSNSSANAAVVEQAAGQLMVRFCEMARTDESGLVRLALGSTLQRLPVSMRAQLATELVKRSVDANDHNLPLVVWHGLIPVAEEYPMLLADVAIACRWPKAQRLMVRRLAERIEEHPAALERVLGFVASQKTQSVQLDILHGLEDGLRGWRKVPQPRNWNRVVEAVRGRTRVDANLSTTVRNLSVVFGDGRAADEVRSIVMDKTADPGLRRSALESMIASRAPGLREACLVGLADARLNVVAAQGLATFDDPEIGRQLIKNYRRFRAPERPKVVAMLVSRKSFADQLVSAIEKGNIAVDELTAFDVRQIRSLGDDELFHRVTKVWGEVRDSTGDKVARIEQLRRQLSSEVLSSADKSHGRALFNKTCSKCHKLYGAGEQIGPDLTGANRSNIDYLLENILDPSAVVGKDFRMSIVQTAGGQVLNGLVVSQDNKSVVLQTQTELMTLPADEVETIRTTSFSPMPDGLLDNLTEQDVRDLFAYLMGASQVE